MIAGPVVDTQSAQEFRREILDLITCAELGDIAAGLERKSRAMRDVLLAGTTAGPRGAAAGAAG